MNKLIERAAALGFERVCILPNEPFPHFERRLHDGALHHEGQGLTAAPQIDYPWANAIVALLMPCIAFAPEALLSGYYINSNKAYHAAGKLLLQLSEIGIRAERVHVPIRELLTRAGVGVLLKNGLTAVEPFGTRFAVQTVVAALDAPDYEPTHTVTSCVDCGRCAAACPTGAIDQDGFHYQKCARAYMGGETMPAWVMDAMTSMLGCDVCQDACPYNANTVRTTEAPPAFALERLLAYDDRDALACIGVNQRKNGRLQQHAAIMAAKSERRDLIPLIERLLLDEREAVRVAASYALDRFNRSR